MIAKWFGYNLRIPRFVYVQMMYSGKSFLPSYMHNTPRRTTNTSWAPLCRWCARLGRVQWQLIYMNCKQYYVSNRQKLIMLSEKASADKTTEGTQTKLDHRENESEKKEEEGREREWNAVAAAHIFVSYPNYLNNIIFSLYCRKIKIKTVLVSLSRQQYHLLFVRTLLNVLSHPFIHRFGTRCMRTTRVVDVSETRLISFSIWIRKVSTFSLSRFPI